MSKADDLFNEPQHADALFEENIPGQPAPDPYKKGPDAQPVKLETSPVGTPADAAKNWANTMTFGAAPELEGAMGALASSVSHSLNGRSLGQALAHPLTGGPEKPQSNQELLDAYREVRNGAAQEHEKAANTALGQLGGGLAYLTPHPLLPTPAPGASIPKRLAYGAGTGGVVGGISGAANSPADLTTGDERDVKRMLKDTGVGMLGGAVTGGAMSGGQALAEGPTRRLAEEQALRAAGLRAGIKNSVQKDLGIQNMSDARDLGRQFLDEGLIPPVGSSEAVAARAEKLQGKAGNAIGATLNQFEVGGHQFDYPEAAEAMRAPIMDPQQTTAVAREQAGKALHLADTIGMDQALDTPGSIIGANRAKSDAWKAANFSADPDLAAVNYRKAVGGLRGNIEDQVGRALGPDTAASLKEANRRYGVGADALKLAENASTRDAAKKGVTMGDVLGLLGGSSAGAMSGHPVAGTGAGIAATLGLKAFDKYGHATTARVADAIANRLASSPGGHVGGMAGQSIAQSLADKYLPHPDDEEKWKSLRGEPEKK